ncbi:Membrin-11 [Acorus calamus]|uniref:Membrin-11 n=1 Tax=Acorus calamus TaxID=4465 RepID=A0AAV9EA96_ACOCL|nr:Membrin-11 [Acorus calamus]
MIALSHKRVQRKALDVLNTVGLSNSVLKLIERRHRLDKWIAYAGMVFTVVAVYAFWRWTH